MKDTIYIVGHRNPDTDSICSAIAYSELKKKLGHEAVAARLGDINKETEFILNYFNIPVPEYLHTVKTQVGDLNIDRVIPVSPEVSIKTAWTLMKKNNVKTLPVVDDNERLLGVATLTDVTSKYMDTIENNIISSSKTPLRNIMETLNAKIVFGKNEDFKTSGNVVVAALSPEQMKPHINSGDIVIVGDRSDTQKTAMELGANCLIITGGHGIEDNLKETAKKYGSVILSTHYDTFATARLINQSIPIRYVMTTENLITFNIDDFVDEIKDKMLQTRYRSYPVVDDTNRILGFISRYHLISQKKKRIILMDHNEKVQSVNGIEEADVLEIIDHHRIADVQTGRPIYFRNEPVGSTSTIVANMYFENGIRPQRSIAGILCAAILSDTLIFKSPTCTYIDIMTSERLAEIAEINIEKFALAMFKAGSSLQDKTPEDIFYQDFKQFTLGRYKIGIGQVSTVGAENIQEIKDSMLEYMKAVYKNNNYNLVMIMLTDVLKEGSELLFVGEDKELIAKAFNVQPGESSVYLPGVVSRKKQVVPPLSAAIE